MSTLVTMSLSRMGSRRFSDKFISSCKSKEKLNKVNNRHSQTNLFLESLQICYLYIDKHMKGPGMLFILFRGVNNGFGTHLGCSGQNAKYRKDSQISRTFFPEIFDQNRRCGKGAVNFREQTFLWSNTEINATLQQQESIGHCFWKFGGS